MNFEIDNIIHLSFQAIGTISPNHQSKDLSQRLIAAFPKATNNISGGQRLQHFQKTAAQK